MQQIALKIARSPNIINPIKSQKDMKILSKY